MKKSLPIENLKQRIGKPVFVVGLRSGIKGWRVISGNGFAETNTLEFTDRSKILEEYLDKFRFFDEEVSEEELKEILDAEEKAKKRTGYETVGKGENYFFITSYMKAIIGYAYHWNDSDDVAREACANHFNDATLTINIARAESLRYQLRRFAALNGGIPSVEDWAYDGNWKYYIAYDYKKQKTYTSCNTKYRTFGQIYFKDENACEKAIEIFKDELLWYFTEFKEMLY